ncbi:MAG TPA: enoyl-CoA hydratase-related protein, partial [Nocardioides sp.]|nr:enoyl-CoA hydratase-related protein [Nocardioides sp.]
MTVLEDAPAAPQGAGADTPPQVDFDTDPTRYRHWRYEVDGETAWVYLDVAEDGGLVPGYELKLNSYDLGVDIELYDLTQRLRFSHPEVRSVVLTSGKESNFCAGANIRMLAQSSHSWKVNFCKFTNETRNGIEDMSANSGQTWVAALNGTAAGGGYEMALACETILLVNDRSSAVALPEVPLLGVLPGTGGLTRVTDKRHVRKDRADIFATKSEGFQGPKAVDWKLVDETVSRKQWDATVRERAAEAAAGSHRPVDGHGISLPPLAREVTEDSIRYPNVRCDIDRGARTATITVLGPEP